MDFSDTASETEFRQTARAWIQGNAPTYLAAPLSGSGFGSTRTGDFDPIAEAKKWQKTKADAGWACIQWPKEYGGRGATPIESVIWSQEEGIYGKLSGTFIIGQGMCAPTMMAYAGEEAKLRYLPKLASGEEIWCQLFSEPHGGSDLAGLRTKAVKDGDTWVINGQKIWTSGAQYADWMFALVRTDPSAAKHEGISFVLLDMHQAGVTVKPIGLISGSSPFCETFLDNATAHRADLIGELNKGWTIGKRLLQFERSGIGGLSGAANKKKAVKTNPLADIAKRYIGDHDGKIGDADYREKILKHSMTERAFQLTTSRVVQENQSGQTPGATTSIFKLVGSTLARDGAALKSELMGAQGLGWEGEGFEDKEIETTRGWLNARAVTIYGGTNEVQMNIIGKRVLGLPD